MFILTSDLPSSATVRVLIQVGVAIDDCMSGVVTPLFFQLPFVLATGETVGVLNNRYYSRGWSLAPELCMIFRLWIFGGEVTLKILPLSRAIFSRNETR